MKGEFPENLYKVLGAEPDATQSQLRRAGRIRQRQTHPDLGGNADEFNRVRLAVEVLTNPRRRAEHDSWLANRTGVAPVRRDFGVRLRQQQHATRSRPKAPRPDPRSTAAGSDSVRAFDSLPKPEFDLRRMPWFRTTWHPQPEVWPPQRPIVHGPNVRELLTVLPFLLCGAGICVAQIMFGLTNPWWVTSFLMLAVSLSWVSLCWLGARPQLARILFLLNMAGISLDAAGEFMLAMLRVFGGELDRAPLYAIRGVLSLIGVGLSILAWWGLQYRALRMSREQLLCDIANETAPPFASSQRIWGAAGATALQRTVGAGNPVRTQYAERIIGEALDSLLRIPGVRIVHDLRLPDGNEAVSTISHGVLCGRRLALIDDRLWHPGRYSLNGRGHLLRDGELMSIPAEEFPHRVVRFRDSFAEVAQVRGWLAITPDALGTLEVDNSRSWQNVRLATVETLLREVGEWLAPDGELVDRLLLRDVIELGVEG